MKFLWCSEMKHVSTRHFEITKRKMKIISAGFPKTGTKSASEALSNV